MELIELFDMNRKSTGKIINRGEEILPSLYYNVVCCCIFNSKGKLLCQQRVGTKKIFPNLFDISCAGAVHAFENSKDAVIREVLEEIGVDISLDVTHPSFTLNNENCFTDVYIIVKDIAIHSLKLKEDEVSNALYLTIEEVKKMIDEGTFIPYHKSLIDLIYDLRNCGESFKSSKC